MRLAGLEMYLKSLSSLPAAPHPPHVCKVGVHTRLK